VRLVQPNIGNFLKLDSERGKSGSIRSVLDSYFALSTYKAPLDLDLIVWPETAYPLSFNSKEQLNSTLPYIFSEISRNDIELNKTYKKYDKQYLTDEFMALDRVTEQLKILMPIDSIIKFNTTASNSTITRFVYSVNILVKDPREFFDMIDVLNNELYSIHIAYPISMVKTQAGIEIEFVLVFNQQNESKEEVKDESK
jgi:hypothetical protein